MYSNNELKRLCMQGGVKLYIPLDDEPYEVIKLTWEQFNTEITQLITNLGFTGGDYFILRIGKKDWRKVCLKM